ncbi:hypothetical protein GE061_018730 [Apolygus lucorum]|uniref:Uncharacterized protein n=1 Tax=Apolygus lucorum TaxID=248454 RepID=A0A8S9X653_APOLU|nr:hypothetical protein GE061_018730 [Apolygus lucorum]
MNTPPVSPQTNPFSPVKVADSPCHSQKGNLTGSPRKVKDSVADIFNSIQKWNNLHVDGLVLLRRISEDLPNR